MIMHCSVRAVGGCLPSYLVPADNYEIFRLAKVLALMRTITHFLAKTIFVMKIFIKYFLKTNTIKIF